MNQPCDLTVAIAHVPARLFNAGVPAIRYTGLPSYDTAYDTRPWAQYRLGEPPVRTPLRDDSVATSGPSRHASLVLMIPVPSARLAKVRQRSTQCAATWPSRRHRQAPHIKLRT